MSRRNNTILRKGLVCKSSTVASNQVIQQTTWYNKRILRKGYSIPWDFSSIENYQLHKTFCILSPLIPKFRVRKGKKNLSKISLHLSKFAIIESPINTNFTLVDDVDMVTCFLKVLYQLNLPFLTNGLISGFIFNGYLINK